MSVRRSTFRQLTLSVLAAATSLVAAIASPSLASPPPGDSGFVMFRGASFPVQESAGHVDVIVRRHRGETGAVSVDLATVDGSALAGEDYVATTATLSWGDGDRGDKVLSIEILSDAVAEGLETFGVTLANPAGGVEIGALGGTVVRILPQGGGGGEPPPGSRIRLRSAVFPAFESAGSAKFVVTRKGGGAGAASVDFATVDGSAIAGDDYTPTLGTLTWNDGETGDRIVSVPLADDAVAERHETVSVTLTNAIGASLGDRDTASILILDDDRGGGHPACIPDEETLCLEDGRFSVRGSWTDFEGRQGPFRAVPSTEGSGMFWFFDENDVEVLVRVIDGCELNSHRWVFFAATTNVAYRLEVVDTLTGIVRPYTNPLGTRAPATTDINAFTCNP